MADAKKTYRSFIGFVKFEPREDTVKVRGEDTEIRSFVIRAVGVKDQAVDVKCTLWPSHEDAEVAEGDAVLVEGAFDVNKAKNKDGEMTTYFNLSVSRIVNLGAGNGGSYDAPKASKKTEVESDDSVPY